MATRQPAGLTPLHDPGMMRRQVGLHPLLALAGVRAVHTVLQGRTHKLETRGQARRISASLTGHAGGGGGTSLQRALVHSRPCTSEWSWVPLFGCGPTVDTSALVERTGPTSGGMVHTPQYSTRSGKRTASATSSSLPVPPASAIPRGLVYVYDRAGPPKLDCARRGVTQAYRIIIKVNLISFLCQFQGCYRRAPGKRYPAFPSQPDGRREGNHFTPAL